MSKGLVGNIQHYSIHDGPGIRSSLFLKGCPLQCAWCHNPESQAFHIQTTWQEEKCLACGDCLAACPAQALTLTPDGIVRDTDRCSNCGACAEACPTLAWERHGYWREAEEVVAELLKDLPFYESSGGGVTISGGEPLSQPEFALDVLARLKEAGIHTALDTSGYAPWQILEQFIPLVDLFLYDIKGLDTPKHTYYMGVSNQLILENLSKLAPLAKEIWLRLPIIPGVNDSPAEITQIGELMRNLQLKRVHLLPYHGLAANKYRKLDMPYTLGDLQAPSDQHMLELQQLLSTQDLDARIGG